MPRSFPVDEAQLVALFLETLFYGIYLVTVLVCVQVLFWKPHRKGVREVNWPLVVVALLMAVFSTLDVTLGLKHACDAFVFYQGPGGPNGEFADVSYWVNVMKTVDVQMMALIGDAMLIYRCHVIYSRSWLVIVFPIALWLANLAVSIVIIWQTSTARTNIFITHQPLLKPFLYSFFSITIVTNFITTALIVNRIWSVNKRSSAYVVKRPSVSATQTSLENIIRILVEAGVAYTALVLATFICELTGSNALYPVSDVLVVVVGISFNLIIIRVHSAQFMSSADLTTHALHLVRDGTGLTTAPVEVMVSRAVDIDTSDERDKATNPVSAPSSQAHAETRIWDPS